jgi:hypothetical protein
MIDFAESLSVEAQDVKQFERRKAQKKTEEAPGSSFGANP